MSYSKMLNNRCSVYRHKDSIKDNITVKKPVLIYENMRCRFVRKTAYGSDTTTQKGRAVITVFYMLYLAKKVDVHNGDIVFIKDEKYIVYEPNKPCGHHTVVMLKREGEA